MALYKPLLFVVMHRTVYELTDATQCPVFMAALARVQLEGRPCPLLHYCNVFAETESCILIFPTCNCILPHTKMPQL